MDDKRYNQMIDLINEGRLITELDPPIQNEEEEIAFNNMQKELKELRKDNPKASFYKVDDEWGIIGGGYLND
jgi:hypothetical protein